MYRCSCIIIPERRTTILTTPSRKLYILNQWYRTKEFNPSLKFQILNNSHIIRTNLHIYMVGCMYVDGYVYMATNTNFSSHFLREKKEPFGWIKLRAAISPTSNLLYNFLSNKIHEKLTETEKLFMHNIRQTLHRQVRFIPMYTYLYIQKCLYSTYVQSLSL